MIGFKILHVVNIIAQRYGGSAIASKLIAQNQVKSGLNITICTTNADFPIGTIPVQTGQSIASDGISTIHFHTQFRPCLVSLSLSNWLNNHVNSYDIVHIHGLYRFPVSIAAWLARKADVPYIITPHGALDPFLYKQSRLGNWAIPLKRLYERFIDIPNLNHASAIHYTSQDEVDRAAFLKLKAKPVIVPNGIDWDTYAKLPVKGLFRDQIGIHGNTPLVLFLGRINFKKGLDLLIPAFSQVLNAVPHARLAIVGPDNEGYGQKVRSWCQEHGIENKVSFIDHLGPDEVKQAYVDADVFVLPSYTENFGMTVVEAIASACPVVISDQVNIWREVQADGAGLVTGLDPRQIAGAICRLLADKEEAKAMGLRGREAANERYNWPRIVDQLSQVYQRAIEEHAVKRQRNRK